MCLVRAKVRTVCIGRASSMGAILLSAGAKGERYVTPFCRVMIHNASGSYPRVTVPDMKIRVAELEAKNDLLVEVFLRHTGRAEAEIRAAMERDRYMDPAEAVKFGLADKILAPGEGIPGETPQAEEVGGEKKEEDKAKDEGEAKGKKKKA